MTKAKPVIVRCCHKSLFGKGFLDAKGAFMPEGRKYLIFFEKALDKWGKR